MHLGRGRSEASADPMESLELGSPSQLSQIEAKWWSHEVQGWVQQGGVRPAPPVFWTLLWLLPPGTPTLGHTRHPRPHLPTPRACCIQGVGLLPRQELSHVRSCMASPSLLPPSPQHLRPMGLLKPSWVMMGPDQVRTGG